MEVAWNSLSEIQIFDKSATDDTSLDDSKQFDDNDKTHLE